MQFLRQPVHDLLPLLFIKLAVFRWRHFCLGDDGKNFHPPIRIFSLQQVGIEGVESNISLHGVRAMTVNAVLIQKWTNHFGEFEEVGFRWVFAPSIRFNRVKISIPGSLEPSLLEL